MLNLHVQPSASSAGFSGRHGEALKLRVQSPPVDSAANEEVCAYLAKFFGVPKSAVGIVHGVTARAKTAQVKGDTSRLLALAAALLAQDTGS